MNYHNCIEDNFTLSSVSPDRFIQSEGFYPLVIFGLSQSHPIGRFLLEQLSAKQIKLILLRTYSYSFNEILGRLTNMIRKSILDIDNGIVCLSEVALFEGRSSNQKLVSKNSKTPQVYCLVVWFVGYHFRGQIVGSAAHGLSSEGGCVH